MSATNFFRFNFQCLKKLTFSKSGKCRRLLLVTHRSRIPLINWSGWSLPRNHNQPTNKNKTSEATTTAATTPRWRSRAAAANFESHQNDRKKYVFDFLSPFVKQTNIWFRDVFLRHLSIPNCRRRRRRRRTPNSELRCPVASVRFLFFPMQLPNRRTETWLKTELFREPRNRMLGT